MNHIIRLIGGILLASLSLLLALSACTDGGQASTDSSLSLDSLPVTTSVPPTSAENVSFPSSSSGEVASHSFPHTSSQGAYTSSVTSQPEEPTEPFLQEAVFVGDFATQQLRYYMTGQAERRATLENVYGIPQFLASDKLGCVSALWPVTADSVHPSWRGNKMALEEALEKIMPARLYLMLGYNDLAQYGVEETYDSFQALLELFQEKLPDTEIYVQSVLPMVKGKEPKLLNSPMVANYNTKLQQLCKEKGVSYLDIATAMADKEGYLLPEYYCTSGDTTYGTPLTDSACQQWLDYLLETTSHANVVDQQTTSSQAQNTQSTSP